MHFIKLIFYYLSSAKMATKVAATKPSGPAAAKIAMKGGKNHKKQFKDKEKPTDIRLSNIDAAKAVADAIRTSLGPKGMDKMIQGKTGDVTITNDGATILKEMQVFHPAARMLVELSKAQDIEAGDGTTSVVVICGALLDAARKLLQRGIHPTTISEAFQIAQAKCVEVLTSIAMPMKLSDTESLIKMASTSLNSKVVSQYSGLLAPLSVQAIMHIIDPETATNVNLKDIRVVAKVGGTVEDTRLINGIVLTQRAQATGVHRVERAKVALIQFCLSPPKSDMDSQVVISDYTQMDRILREERAYILDLCKKIKKSGANVLLIQKSILRDALNDMALHFLTKMKVLVVKDIERDEIDFVSRTLGCRPIATADHMLPEHLGQADLVEEIHVGGGSKVVSITGCQSNAKTCSILVQGSNKLLADEAERSIHDALCVIRCLVKNRNMIAGGGAPEIELSIQLAQYAATLSGVESHCIKAFADALEIIPFTLAENAGLPPINIVTELRNRHAEGEAMAGINVKKCCITNITEENVLQPLLVSISAITLASETVRSILKIDDIVNTSR